MKIIAIVIGRKGSTGFPDKNIYPIAGKPMVMHSIDAASECEYIDKVIVSTDDNRIADLVDNYENVKVSWRPIDLATNEALGEEVFRYEAMRHEADLFVLLFANAPCINSRMIHAMLQRMKIYGTVDVNGKKEFDYDGICTVSKYNMFDPSRAWKIETINRDLNNPKYMIQLIKSDWVSEENISCDRSRGISSWFYDCSCAIVTSNAVKNLTGPPPQRWLGRKIYPYIQKYPAIDVDYEWQVPQVEWWHKMMLKEEG